MSNVTKIRPVGAEFSVRTNGRADLEKLITAFRFFANASNNGIFRDVEHRVYSRVLAF